MFFPEIFDLLKDYLKDSDLDPKSKNQDKLTAYLTFHDIPRLKDLNKCLNEEGE